MGLTMSLTSDLDRLEQSGQWLQALEILRQQLRLGVSVDADHLHSIGRLYQRLGLLSVPNVPVGLTVQGS